MSAIGAMGHELVDLQDVGKRAEFCKSAIKKLSNVNWEKGKHWEGIAGKFGMKGKFSTSGAKDAAYAIYSALNDETASGFKVIRNGNGATQPQKLDATENLATSQVGR